MSSGSPCFTVAFPRFGRTKLENQRLTRQHQLNKRGTARGQIQVNGYKRGNFPLGVPEGGELRLPQPPEHGAQLRAPVIHVVTSGGRFPRLKPWPVVLPAPYLFFKAVRRLPAEWAGTAGLLPGPEPACPQPLPEAPEPLGRRTGLVPATPEIIRSGPVTRRSLHPGRPP